MNMPGLPAPAFLNRQSEEFVSFKKVIEFFKPKSVFAKKVFMHLRPLLFEELKENFDFLKKVEKCEGERKKAEGVLEDFHEITASLKAVENVRATSVDLFEIKRFVHHHKLLAQIECLDGFFEPLNDVWNALSPTQSASYAFSPTSEEIRLHLRTCSVLQKKISNLYKAQSLKAEKLYGVKVEGKKFVLERRKGMKLLSSNLFVVEREGLNSYTFALRPTNEIIELEHRLLEEEKSLKSAQEKEVKRLCGYLSKRVEKIRNEISKIVKLDMALAKLRSLKNGWSYPSFGDVLWLEDAFHPLIKNEVEEMNLKYEYLNGEFFKGLTMIFGPNMGGKTTVLRTIGLISSLAMYGFLVPAKRALLPVINWIRYIGNEEGKDGLSRFAKQMYETKKALELEGKGVILIDEFGSGTNPYEGEALASALAEYLEREDNFSIMVTHYRKAIEAVDCEKYTMGRLKFDEDITLENISAFVDHTLKKGVDVKLGDAIKLAEIIGIPEKIMRRARDVLIS